MKNFLRKKLGVSYTDTTLVDGVEAKIEKFAPVRLKAELSETTNGNQAFKTINVGTIRKPSYQIVSNIENTNSFFSVQDPNIKYYFGRSAKTLTFNGQAYIYKPDVKNLDPNNPYDPIFSSFNRLSSFAPRLVQSGKLTGITPQIILDQCYWSGPVRPPESGNNTSCKQRGTTYVTTTQNPNSICAVNTYWQEYSGSTTPYGKITGVCSGSYRNLNLDGQLTPFSLSYDSVVSGSNRQYTFGNFIDRYYWNQGDGFNMNFLLFDGSGELGYGTNKWLGLSTQYYDTPLGFREITDMGYLDASGIAYRNARTPHLPKLVTLVATSPNQSKSSIPTTSWSGIARAPYTDIWESHRNASGIRIEVSITKKRLEPVITGWLYSKIEMGGKEEYLSLNNNSFVNGYGFYKIATTRKSFDVNHIYARLTGTTLQVGEGYGATPNGYFKVTYPHSYLTKSYGALRYNAIIVPELINNSSVIGISGANYASGINDIIVISTGINEKKIIYVSPNSVLQFTGFWSESVTTNRAPVKKVRSVSGNLVTGYTNKTIETLKSGRLLSISSKNTLIKVKQNWQSATGKVFLNDTVLNNITFNDFINYTNIPDSMLKTTSPLSGNNYYKLYEPIYRPNAFNTGTWNGIIPSGTPFQIEIIRTNSNTYGLSGLQLGIYLQNYFDNSPILYSGYSGQTGPTGQSGVVYGGDNSKYGLFGVFEGRATIVNQESEVKAVYLSENKSYNVLMSKLNGALWDKGFSKGNSKSNKIIKLFNGGAFPLQSYYYINSTGQKISQIGLKTSAGIRTQDGNVIEIDQASTNQGATWIKEN